MQKKLTMKHNLHNLYEKYPFMLAIKCDMESRFYKMTFVQISYFNCI